LVCGLAAFAAVSGCAHATGAGGPPATDAAPPAATPPGPPQASAAEFDSLYRARTAQDRTRFNEADVRFISGMIHHHAQAIEMSRMAPTHGASSQVQTLAARIINAQQDEIALMQRWLRDRNQPVPAVQPTGMMTMDHGNMDHSAAVMPGMLTAAQMQELDRARGTAFDRAFLTFMIQHHRGAVSMVRTLFATDGAGQGDAVFKLASDVQADQTTEVRRMELMLAALPER
jgi:uncharacterized protein (DUF305 family)